MIQKLNLKFNKKFGPIFGELNSKFIKMNPLEDGNYEIPLPILSDGGATMLPNSADAVQLEPAAKVTFEIKKVEPTKIVYRIEFALEDAAKAAEDDTYFDYLVVPVVEQAIARYQKTFGDYKNIRYGKTFCDPYRVGDTDGSVFRESDTGVEFRLFGSWASNKAVV